MEEIWKPIDDRYSVSNLGRVKSNYANKVRILKPFKNHDGYLMVDIRHPNYRNSVSVHRLVAIAFIPNSNPEKYKEVNHKDEDKTNNCVDNLEWCDTFYNCNYGTRNIRKGIACRKPIFSVDEYGNISNYNSIKEAYESTGISKTTISKALSGNSNNKTAGGMLWFYNNEDTKQMVNELDIKAKLNKRKVYSMDKNGNIEYFNSIAEASRKTGINNINRALKNKTIAGNRQWFYTE